MLAHVALTVSTVLSSSALLPAFAEEPPPPAAQPGIPAPDAKLQAVKIAYLGFRRPAPPIYDYEAEPSDVGVAGAKIAMRDMKTTGRLTGQDFSLDEVLLGKGQSPVEAAKTLVAKGEALIVADLPTKDLLAVSDALKDTNAALYSIQSQDDSLRNADCRANIFDIAPSRSMLTDALVQFLVYSQWPRIFLVVGKAPEDQLYAQAVRDSAKKFGAKLVGDKVWEFGDLAKARADGPTQTSALVFTRGTSADMIVVADEAGNFGDYVQYHTSEPKLVGGTQGLIPATWSRVLDSWGLGPTAEPVRARQQAADAPARLPGVGGDPHHRRGGDALEERRPETGGRLRDAAGLRDRRLQGRAGAVPAVGPAAVAADPARAAEDVGLGRAGARLPAPRQPASRRSASTSRKRAARSHPERNRDAFPGARRHRRRVHAGRWRVGACLHGLCHEREGQHGQRDRPRQLQGHQDGRCRPPPARHHHEPRRQGTLHLRLRRPIRSRCSIRRRCSRSARCRPARTPRPSTSAPMARPCMSRTRTTTRSRSSTSRRTRRGCRSRSASSRRARA